MWEGGIVDGTEVVQQVSYVLRLCTPFSVPVDMFAAVEWKKLMWFLFKGKDVTRLFLGAAVGVDVTVIVFLAVVKRSLEVLVKDARIALLL